MDNITRVEYSLPPFDVVVRSSLLIKRKGRCAAPIAQSSSAAGAISEDQLDEASGSQQQNHSAPLLNVPEPAFELRIRCRQVVEQFTATTAAIPAPTTLPNAPGLLPGSPIELLKDRQIHYPCRVKDSRVLVEHNHFINSVNVTTCVVQGQPFLSTLSIIKDHPMPRWSLYGISQVEPEIPYNYTSPSNKAWFRVRTSDLPPTGTHLSETILKHITLDYYWTSSSSTAATTLRDRLSSHLGTTLSPLGHSLETMAMMTGLDRTLFALAHNHPLIFSPRRIRWFCDTIRDNRWIVASLLGICWNATSPGMRDSMTQSIQRIRQQFPSVPQGNTALLLETALEALAYRTIMTGGTKSRKTTIWTGVGPGSGARGRDSSTPIPVPILYDADIEIKEPMAANKTEDNNNDNDAREPTSPLQRQQRQQWEERGGRTNKDLQWEEGNDDDLEGFKDNCLQPFVPREPINQQQCIVLTSLSNNNNNSNSKEHPPPPPAAAALVPDCSTSGTSLRIQNFFNVGVGDEIADEQQVVDVALGQNLNQQQHGCDHDHDHDHDYDHHEEQCLELDLEMDELDKQSEQSDFFEFSEEEQQFGDDDDENDGEDEIGLVEEDEGEDKDKDSELWGGWMRLRMGSHEEEGVEFTME